VKPIKPRGFPEAGFALRNTRQILIRSLAAGITKRATRCLVKLSYGAFFTVADVRLTDLVLKFPLFALYAIIYVIVARLVKIGTRETVLAVCQSMMPLFVKKGSPRTMITVRRVDMAHFV
jgi:hypothetical protein